MAVRNRLRNAVLTGSRTERFSPYRTNTRSYESLYEHCEDTHLDDGGDNLPLTITRVTRSGGLINGTEGSLLTGYIWNDYPCTYWTDPFTINHLSILNQPSDGVLATSAIARTNPSRNQSTLLEYAGELADYGKEAERKFDEGLRGITRKFPRKTFQNLNRLAKLNLLTQFALLPLISDIELLLSFQQAVDKRVDEIERLRTRGLRRTVDLWEGDTSSSHTNVLIQSQGVTLRCDLNKVTKVSIRGHVRWRCTSNWIQSDALVRAQARKAILGYDLDPTTLYELMPWSWLIDYFTNLGTMVKATRNHFDAVHDVVKIMTHSRTVMTSSNHTTDGGGANIITCTPMHSMREDKRRRPTTPSIGSRIEFLQPAQWSILGSLAVLRGLDR